MSEQRVATLIVEVAGRQTNLDQLLRRLQQELRKSQSDAGATADAIGGKLAAGQNKGSQSALTHAQSLARLAKAEGDTAAAVEILRNALAGADKSTAAAIRAQTQLANLQRQLRAEMTGTKSALEQLNAAAGKFGGALGALGFAVGIGQVVQFGIAAGQQANELEKTQAALRAVAGDQAKYDEVLRIASGNQKLFGGTLQANLAPLQQFLFISNRTGASLQELNQVAQLLAAVNPMAGIEGAGFSLSEVLSGDITSIVERFNLPRAAVRELVKEADSAGEVLSGITTLLGSMGVTSETLAASLDTNAAAYDRLGAATSNLTTQLGSLVSQGFAPAAVALTGFFEQLAGGLNQLGAVGGNNGGIRDRLLADTASYEEYTARIAQAQQLAGEAMNQAYAGDPLAKFLAQAINAQPVIQALTQEQFNLYNALVAAGIEASVAAERAGEATNAQIRYAEGLVAAGASAADAATQAVAYGDAINATNQASGQLYDDTTISSAALQQLAGDMEFLTGTSDANRAAVTDLANSYLNGGISANELYNQVNTLIGAHFGEIDATQAVIDAAYAAAQAHVDAAIGADENTTADELLDQQARLTADALLASGSAGAAAAQQLANSTSKIDQLTAGYYRLAAAQAVAGQGAAAGGLDALGKGLTGGPRSAGKGQGESVLDKFRREAAAEAAEAAERAARSGGGGGGGGRSGGGGGGGSGKTPKASQAEKDQQRLAEQERKFQEQRLNDQEKLNDQIQESEAEHYERLLDIQKDFEEKSLKQQRENEVSKRRSKFDFYSSLTEAESSGDIDAAQAQALSAAYEQAYAESQRIAQAGNQQLAAEYLELKQRQIEAELEFQEAVAAAREKGDKAEIARLERLAALRRDAEAAELENLMAEGDENVKDRDEALGEESERYKADQAKIAGAAEEAANRKTKAAEQSTKAIQAETQALKEQADLLAALNNQKLQNPGTGATTTPQGAPVPADPAASAPQSSDPAAEAAADAGELATLLSTIARLQEDNNTAIGKVAKAIERLAQTKPFQ
jgi:hypothetical protein